MLMAAFGSERVFIPDPLQVNQRPLALAKRQMLQRGNREKIVFGEHKNLRRTPGYASTIVNVSVIGFPSSRMR